jgi:HAD superfamily hydrolase (TIGR01509 family)
MRERLGVGLAPEEIDRRVVGLVLEGYRRSLPLLPGAQAAVRTLGAHWPLGLASSSNRVVIDEVLALADLREHFAVTVSSEEVARGKPAPDVYVAVLHRLHVGGERAAAVEDSTNGLLSAAAAGMCVVAVPNREFPPAPEALKRADVVLESLELLDAGAIASLLDTPVAKASSVPGR